MQRRPQTPVPPFPYTSIDTSFVAPDGAVMSATLTLPSDYGQTPVPAVVMITGSGMQNRDEEAFDHRPFAVIADWLARHGIASLRYDDRGTARSTGDLSNATTETFRDDALAGVRFLRSLKGIGPVGALGHSEGGTIAFMLGADGNVDFLVSLAGMAETGKNTVLAQNRRALDQAGLSEAEKYSAMCLIGKLIDEIESQGRRGVTEHIDVDSLAAASGLTVDPRIMASLRDTDGLRTPWFDAFLGLDPSKYISRVKCPILAFGGDKDTQVNAGTNLAIITKYAPQAKIMLMPGLNHMLQHAVTGDVSEYSEISETISPEVLQIISDFIRSQKLPK